MKSMESVEVTKLSNGIRVASDKMSSVETVTISVWVNVGSRFETKSENGLSHFLEHMAFKGTDSRTAKDISEEFDNIGGKVNAFTSRERTVYYAKVLKDDAEKATEIIADILQNSKFSEEEIEKEREVILQEIAMTNDTPDDIIDDYHQATVYPDQSIGRPILGSKVNVETFTRDNLIKYVKDKYTASNMVVCFAGNITHGKAVKLANRYFNGFETGKPNLIEQVRYEGGEFKKQKKLEQVHMILGFKGVSYNDPDFYKINLLSMVLGGGMSSRLFTEVRENRGLAYSIYAYNSALKDAGEFKIYASATPKNINDLILVTFGELDKISDNIMEQELRKTKNQLRASILMSREGTSQRAQKLGSDLLGKGRIIPMEEMIENIESIDKASLKKLANKLFFSSPTTFTCLGPVKQTLTPSDVKRLVRK